MFKPLLPSSHKVILLLQKEQVRPKEMKGSEVTHLLVIARI